MEAIPSARLRLRVELSTMTRAAEPGAPAEDALLPGEEGVARAEEALVPPEGAVARAVEAVHTGEERVPRAVGALLLPEGPLARAEGLWFRSKASEHATTPRRSFT